MRRLRVGIIGVGKMAEISHLPILATLPQIELVAFCDPDETNLNARGDQYGVAHRYRDHHDLLEREPLDAVCLFVPPFAHTDAEIIAAEQGLGVFVEKPPALSMAKAHEVCAALTRTGVINAVGFQERYRQSVQSARERLDGRRIVQALVHRLHGSKALAYWWMVEELSGGAFVENTIHAVDLLRYLGGDFASVSARIVERPGKTAELDIPLSHCATFVLAGGGVATVTTCTALAHSGHSQFLYVAGEELCDLGQGKLTVDGAEVACDDPGRAAYAQEFATFFEAVATGRQELIRAPYTDAVKSLAAVLGAVDSARQEGTVVDLTAPPYVAAS